MNFNICYHEKEISTVWKVTKALCSSSFPRKFFKTSSTQFSCRLYTFLECIRSGIYVALKILLDDVPITCFSCYLKKYKQVLPANPIFSNDFLLKQELELGSSARYGHQSKRSFYRQESSIYSNTEHCESAKEKSFIIIITKWRVVTL